MKYLDNSYLKSYIGLEDFDGKILSDFSGVDIKIARYFINKFLDSRL